MLDFRIDGGITEMLRDWDPRTDTLADYIRGDHRVTSISYAQSKMEYEQRMRYQERLYDRGMANSQRGFAAQMGQAQAPAKPLTWEEKRRKEIKDYWLKMPPSILADNWKPLSLWERMWRGIGYKLIEFGCRT